MGICVGQGIAPAPGEQVTHPVRIGRRQRTRVGRQIGHDIWCFLRDPLGPERMDSLREHASLVTTYIAQHGGMKNYESGISRSVGRGLGEPIE
jgi:hypothetical protein